MSRDLPGGSRLLSVVAVLVAIGGLVLASMALPMLTAQAPAGGSLEEGTGADGAGEAAVDRADPETAGAGADAAAGEAPGVAADAEPDEATVESIREGVSDSDAGTALLGVAAVVATVGGAGEELPPDAVDPEDVEGLEDMEGYGQGEAQAEREGDLDVPPGLGSLGGELGDLAAESAPPGDGEGEGTDVELEGTPDGELEADEVDEANGELTERENETEDAGGSLGGGEPGGGSWLLGAIPGGGTTVAVVVGALVAVAAGLALRGGASARSLSGLFVSRLLGSVVALARGSERVVSTLLSRPGELAGLLRDAIESVLSRFGFDAGGAGSRAEISGENPPDPADSGARGRIREAFSGVVEGTSLTRSRARVATPEEVAGRAVESGLEGESVATITEAFRDVEYGGVDPESRVDRVAEASDELSGARGSE